MTRSDAILQAEQLLGYSMKPGASVSWLLDSKDFAPADRAAILIEWRRLRQVSPTVRMAGRRP